jgi:hypothetical protein
MPTLSAAFIEPALAFIEQCGGTIRFGARLRAIRFDGDSVRGLDFGDADIPLTKNAAVVLAVPPWSTASLVPGLEAPDEFCSIVSIHYRATPPDSAPLLIGLIGATAEWVFSFPDRISVTISNADRLIDEDREILAKSCWRDVEQALGFARDLPSWQVVKEKRATFAATQAQDEKRPKAATRWRNLMLAGDWTATGLPATIEGAVRSGQRAAQLVLARMPM